METINNENSKKQLSHDSHSVLNMADRALDAKVEESSFLKFFKKNFYIFFLITIFIVGFFLFNYLPKNIKTEDIQYVKIAGQKIKTDLALTSETRARGLSGRVSLKEDDGMLFVFDNVGKYKFWMKDMNFDIDIVWIDENQKVVYIQKNATRESYPETFGGEQNSKYVLELVSGFSDKHNLKEGDKVNFE